MGVARAIGGFLYDLLVGDSWRLALAAVAVLATMVSATLAGLLPAVLVPVCVLVAFLVVVPATVVLEARAGARR